MFLGFWELITIMRTVEAVLYLTHWILDCLDSTHACNSLLPEYHVGGTGKLYKIDLKTAGQEGKKQLDSTSHGCLGILQKPTVQSFTLLRSSVVDTGLQQNKSVHSQWAFAKTLRTHDTSP